MSLRRTFLAVTTAATIAISPISHIATASEAPAALSSSLSDSGNSGNEETETPTTPVLDLDWLELPIAVLQAIFALGALVTTLTVTVLRANPQARNLVSEWLAGIGVRF